MIHAKTATIDGAWSTVGTANIDRLSLAGNYEINTEFFDASMATTGNRSSAATPPKRQKSPSPSGSSGSRG